MVSQELKSHLAEAGMLWGAEQHPYGVSGFMTYGPAGKSVKNKLEAQFLNIFTEEGFDDIETAAFLPTESWEASGHLAEFKDEMFHTQTPQGRSLTARPELATTIYPLYSRLAQQYGNTLPFRVYQKGLALPNDRQTEWQLRTRQYTAHEGHIFSEKSDVDVETTVNYLSKLATRVMACAGLRKDTLTFREKRNDDTPFYATRAYGLYTTMRQGDELELLGVQYRASRDFERHSQMTGVKLATNGEHPEAFEISFSTDRPFLALMERSLRQRNGKGMLALPHDLAPWSAIIATNERDDPGLQNARRLRGLLRKVDVDTHVVEHGSTRSNYQRADAQGVPYVITSTRDSDIYHISDRGIEERVAITLEGVSNHASKSKKVAGLDLLRQVFKTGTVDIQ